MKTVGMGIAFGLAVASLGVTDPASAADTSGSAPTDGRTTRVELRNAEGEPAGSATLRETPNGVLLTAELRNLPPGEHAFHVHETGTCTPPFESAGGHFAPDGSKHGFEDAAGPHPGDMPNIHVAENGTASVDVFLEEVSLDGGLLDDDGAALVVHDGADDYHTDPAGASGARIACGVIGGEARTGQAEREPRTAAAGE